MSSLSRKIPSAIIELDEAGENYRIVWGLVNGGRPTSELPSHLMNLEVKKLQDPEVSCCLSCTYDQYHCPYLCSSIGGQGLYKRVVGNGNRVSGRISGWYRRCTWMVPGGREIAVATSELMKKYDLAIWAHHGTFAAGEDFDRPLALCIRLKSLLRS